MYMYMYINTFNCMYIIFLFSSRAVRDFLSGQPLIDFVDSPFYWRFLQWKTLERYMMYILCVYNVARKFGALKFGKLTLKEF